jgi:hypothetical protein
VGASYYERIWSTNKLQWTIVELWSEGDGRKEIESTNPGENSKSLQSTPLETHHSADQHTE